MNTSRSRSQSERQHRVCCHVLTCLSLLLCLICVPSDGFAEKKADPYDALYNAIMSRKTPKGEVFGLESPVPLLWRESDYLIADGACESFVKALDDFAALSQREMDAYSDVKRALLQRHLWAVFDWAGNRRPPTYEPESGKLTAARFAIQQKTAALMNRLALSDEEIRELPNGITVTEKLNKYPEKHDPKDHLKPFFPKRLLDTEGPWVCLRRDTYGLIGHFHAEFAEWRAAFLVFMRSPGGRDETLKYLKQLGEFRESVVYTERGYRTNPKTPQFPVGTQFAIVEQAMLINDQGELVASPLVNRIQLRAYLSIDMFIDLPKIRKISQTFAEFVMQPKELMQGNAALKALGRNETHYTVFFANEPFRNPRAKPTQNIPLQTCVVCHRTPGIDSVNSRTSFQSSVHIPFKLREAQLGETYASTAHFKRKHYTWGLLQGIWRADKVAALNANRKRAATRINVPDEQYRPGIPIKKAGKSTLWSEPNKTGLRLGISGVVDRGRYAAGRMLPIQLSIWNDGKEPVKINPTGIFGAGLEAWLVERSGKKFGLFDRSMMSLGPGPRYRLEPGQFAKLHQSPYFLHLILANSDGSASATMQAFNGFVIRPGTYTLKVEAKFGDLELPQKAKRRQANHRTAPGIGEWEGRLFGNPVKLTILEPEARTAKLGDSVEFARKHRIEFGKESIRLSHYVGYPGLAATVQYKDPKTGKLVVSRWGPTHHSWKVSSKDGNYKVAWDAGGTRLWFVDDSGIQHLRIGDELIDQGHWTMDQAKEDLAGMPDSVRRALSLPSHASQSNSNGKSKE